MSVEREKELRDIAKDMLPDPIIVIGYVEHQLDLMAQIISDLAKKVDAETFTEEERERIRMLDAFIQHTSVDFDDPENPLQAYRIPKAIELKEHTRDVQERYIKKKLQEGLF